MQRGQLYSFQRIAKTLGRGDEIKVLEELRVLASRSRANNVFQHAFDLFFRR